MSKHTVKVRFLRDTNEIRNSRLGKTYPPQKKGAEMEMHPREALELRRGGFVEIDWEGYRAP